MKKKVGLVKTPETVSAVLKLATPETVSGVLEDYSGLDAAASTAKWAELDGAVDDSINAIHGNFVELAARLILVRSFLSQRGDPVRKALLDTMVGFEDITWSEYLAAVALKLCKSVRYLQDKIAGFELGLPAGQNGSTVARDKRKAKPIPAGVPTADIQAQANLKQARVVLGAAADGGNEQAKTWIADYEKAAGVSSTEIEMDEPIKPDWLDAVALANLILKTREEIVKTHELPNTQRLDALKELADKILGQPSQALQAIYKEKVVTVERVVETGSYVFRDGDDADDAFYVPKAELKPYGKAWDTPDEADLDVLKRLERIDELGRVTDLADLLIGSN